MLQEIEVSLRVANSEDAKCFFAWRSDQHIIRWCRQSLPLKEGDHLRWWDRMEHSPTDHVFTVMAKFIRDEHGSLIHYPNAIPVGYAALYHVDPVVRNAEFSFYIAPAFQDKGIGQRALSLLLAIGFDTLNLNKIEGETWENNPALKLFALAGFTTEGCLRARTFKEGRYWNSLWIGILAEEWRKRPLGELSMEALADSSRPWSHTIATSSVGNV